LTIVLTVIYDANVLYPAPLRDLLIRLGSARLCRARWTETILDEVFASLVAHRPELSIEALARTRELMCAAVPDCLVLGWEPIVQTLQLPDPDDRHVLAAAIHAGAQVVVTRNLKDFPVKALASFGIEAQHPDEFVLGLVQQRPTDVLEILRQQQNDLRRNPKTIQQLLEIMERQGLVCSVAELRHWL
jgi:predicted nucleic acid-binding protein